MKYQQFGRLGLLISEPVVLIRLEGSDDTFGSADIPNRRDVLYWLVRSVLMVPADELQSYCKERDPRAVVTVLKSATVVIDGNDTDIEPGDEISFTLSGETQIVREGVITTTPATSRPRLRS